MAEITDGVVFSVMYPFYAGTFFEMDEDGGSERQSWIPGTRVEFTECGDIVYIGDGVGTMNLKVVGVFKPQGFPTRVFYTRQFVAPNGKEFGGNKCHIATQGKFKRLTMGYGRPYTLMLPQGEEGSSNG